MTCPFLDDLARVDVPQLHYAIITPANHFLPAWRQRYHVYFTVSISPGHPISVSHSPSSTFTASRRMNLS
jgi:hypothetical protein